MYSISQPRPQCRLVYVIGVALFSIVIVGCGRPAHQLETAPVRGKVTLDGKALPSGYVVVPTSRGRMASGKIEPDGTFVMTTYSEGDGVQLGVHAVVVQEVPRDEFSTTPAPRVAIPTRYTSAGTSGLKVDVKADGDNYLELKLTTEKQQR
jgi:hypothetical protein